MNELTGIRVTIDLEILNRLTHDLWFDSELIRHDQSQQVVELDLGINKKRTSGELKLAITGVLAVAVEDEAKIGVYQLDRIEIQPNLVIVRSSFPLVLFIRVGENAELSISAP